MIKMTIDIKTDKEKQKLLDEARLKRKEERRKRKIDTNRVTGV